MKHFVLAPDSFKGTISAAQVSTPTAFPQIKCVTPSTSAQSTAFSNPANKSFRCGDSVSSPHGKCRCPVKQQVMLQPSVQMY